MISLCLVGQRHLCLPGLLPPLFTFFKKLKLKFIQAHLGDMTVWVPDHHNKASIAIKPVIIFLLVKGLAFNLLKTQHLQNSTKQNIKRKKIR